jgi:hypothetical protein
MMIKRLVLLQRHQSLDHQPQRTAFRMEKIRSRTA